MQIKQQIETSINSAQGKLNPGNRGHSGRPNFEATEDEEEISSFGPPVVDFGDTERFKRGSQPHEKFHKNDKKAAGYDNKKTYRQPLQKIQYNREGIYQYLLTSFGFTYWNVLVLTIDTY